MISLLFKSTMSEEISGSIIPMTNSTLKNIFLKFVPEFDTWFDFFSRGQRVLVTRSLQEI